MTNELIDKTASNIDNNIETKEIEIPTSSKYIDESNTVMDNSSFEYPAAVPGQNNGSNDFSNLKNKTGNGLKSKNSNRRQDINQSGPSLDVLTPKRLKLDVPNNDAMEGVSLIARQLEEDTKVFSNSNMPFETNTSALSSCNSSASSSSSSSPSPFFGPVWPIGQLTTSSTPTEISEKVVPPLVDLVTPEVITVDESPLLSSQPKDNPVVVDLCQADNAEIQMLYKQFCEMFPDTPKLYLEQQAADLVGKHAAINRFIDELFENDSKPPEYWKPDVLTIPVNLNASEKVTNDYNQIGSLDVLALPTSSHNEFNKLSDLTPAIAEATFPRDNSSLLGQPQNDLPPVNQTSSAGNTSIANNLDNISISIALEKYDEPVPGPSGTQKRSGLNEPLVENIATAPPDSSNDSVVEPTDTEEEKREQQMDKRVQNLLSLFPQKDPEYLRAKNNEFGLDTTGATAFEAWVLEVVENGGKNLPSREDYDKRKKVMISLKTFYAYYSYFAKLPEIYLR